MSDGNTKTTKGTKYREGFHLPPVPSCDFVPFVVNALALRP
jgi:hypothetical protein